MLIGSLLQDERRDRRKKAKVILKGFMLSGFVYSNL